MIEIIKINNSSVNDLQKISRQTFIETFDSSNTEEDMQNYIARNLSTEKLIKELANTQSHFYFALIEDDIVGYLKLNEPATQSDKHYAGSLEIERIYVLKEFHGKKIGQELLDKGIDFATKNNFSFIWLGVWEHNKRAINFYQKNKFEIIDKHIFTLGSDEQIDLIMKLQL